MKYASILIIAVFVVISGCGEKLTDTPADFNSNPKPAISENSQEEKQITVPETEEPPETEKQTYRAPEKEEVKIPETTTQTNEERAIMRSLYEAGMDAKAQITDSQTTVSFALAQGLKEKNAAYYVFGIASNFTLPENTIIVEINNSGKVVSYSVLSGKVADFFNGKVSEQEFEKEVKIGGT